MATYHYEGMFLLDSADFASDHDGMTAMLTDLLGRFGGEVVAHRAWSDARLAYEIKGRRKGVHYLVMFNMDGSKMGELNRAIRLNEKILRSMFIRHPQVLFDANVAAISPDAEAAGEPVTAAAE